MKTLAAEKDAGLIKCPVCDWPPTAEELCPHCGTDLSPLWRLLSLPQSLDWQGKQLRQINKEAGLQYLTAAAVLEPQSVYNHLTLGEALLAQERSDQALTQIEAALALEPENPAALELQAQVQAIMHSQQTAGRERQKALWAAAERKTVSRWKKYTFAASGLAFVTAMLLFVVIAITVIGRHPLRVERGPSSQEVADRVAAILASDFPMLDVEATPEEVQLKGKLATYRDFVRVWKRLEGLPLLNFDGITVSDEQFLTYRVRAGDSLIKLAIRFYGLSSRWTLIREANRERIPNADLLQPGVLLKIPLIKE